MKTFLINLDRDKDRFAFVDEQLRRLEVDYQRVKAVDAKILTRAERKNAFSSFRWWCAIGRPVAPAEIGCALSHYDIYQRMAADEAMPYCCVLEDDVELSARFNSTLQDVAQWIDPMRPQVVILNDHQSRYKDFAPGIHRSIYGGMCTDGYILTRIAAQNLMKANFPIIVPCDTWGRWVRLGRIELYHVVPAVVRQVQDVFGTSTSEGRINVAKMPLPKRINYKAKRVVGKVLDSCLMKVTGR